MARILLVEDEPELRDLLHAALLSAGHQVAVAEDGEAGVKNYQWRPPDVVVMDLIMPKKGGLVAIKEIRQLDPNARIVAISGGGRTGRMNFLSTARTFPGVRTLAKPFSLNDLLSQIEDVLGTSAVPTPFRCGC